MNISLNWLKEYVDIDVSVDELAHQMTMLGLEIEAVHALGEEIQNVFVGQITAIEPHPDADKLVVCKNDIGGEEPLTIVCGAKNMKVGDRVPTAVIGATLPGGFKIGRRKMRGIESQGMMCSGRELGLNDDQSGLLILDADLPLGADIKPILGLDDVVLEIEVTPNRGDWASMIGVAREIAALYNKPLRIPEVLVQESATKAAQLSSVTIEAPDLCPRYMGRVLENVKVGPSPEWLCRRLVAAGQRPINNIVDITNFVLLETGHPLHAFDYNKLGENRVVVRRAAEGETMVTLDDEKRMLTPDMLVIADANRPQAVAGVMGGADSEVGESTTRVFLESAYFLPASIRKTSRQLGLISEASQHFQRGADPEMAVYAMERAAQLMQELAQATVAPGVLDEYPNPLEVREVQLRYARTNLLLGTTIAPEIQKSALEKLGFEILSSSETECTVRVPLRRHDVSMEADLIEEVARLYGYDNIAVSLPRARQNEAEFAPEEKRLRALRHFLVGLGLTELYNWSFSSPEDVQRAQLPEDYHNMVALQNPLSEKHATMRSSLLPAVLNNVAYNLRHGVAEITAFEMGPVFLPGKGEELPLQKQHLAVVMHGSRAGLHWSGQPEALDFYDLKGVCEALADHFGVVFELEVGDALLFQEGQRAVLRHENEAIGMLGKVCSSTLKNYDIEGDIFLLEMDIDTLVRTQKKANEFEPIPGFPPSLRDMAIVVDQSVAAGDLMQAALASGGKLLKSVGIFDIYTGEQVAVGKKSVALTLKFQSTEKTLTDKNTQKAFNSIYKQLKNKFGAELR